MLFQGTFSPLSGALLVCLIMLPSSSLADLDQTPRDKPGLIWNRSGLPAVFPLQVKTTGDQSYVMTLINKETAKAVLAAYVVGGEFFKILVPPGTYTVQFAGLNTGPSDDTRDVFELSDSLVFRTLGLSTKAGHVIDLTENFDDLTTRITVKPQFICQNITNDYSSTTPRRHFSYRDFIMLDDHREDTRLRRNSAYGRNGPYAFAWPDYLHWDYSTFSVRSSYCE